MKNILILGGGGYIGTEVTKLLLKKNNVTVYDCFYFPWLVKNRKRIKNNKRLNLILKDLYGTNYFEDVSVSFENKILTIFVKENPIVQKINYKGIKSKTLLESIIADKLIREKSSYNLIFISLVLFSKL